MSQRYESFSVPQIFFTTFTESGKMTGPLLFRREMCVSRYEGVVRNGQLATAGYPGGDSFDILL